METVYETKHETKFTSKYRDIVKLKKSGQFAEDIEATVYETKFLFFLFYIFVHKHFFPQIKNLNTIG